MIEARIPISPRPEWFNRAKLITASLREFYPDTLVRLSIGDDWIAPGAYKNLEEGSRDWFNQSPLNTISVINRNDFLAWQNTRAEYLATILDTFKPPFTGDHILHMDGDVMPMARFDELLKIDAICGVQAHHAPYGVAGWQSLFSLFGLGQPPLDVPYSGWGSMFNDQSQRFGPPYFNSGMVFGPRPLFERLAGPYLDIIDRLCGYVTDRYWFDQLGLALAFAEERIPTRHLPLRYNFPNRPSFELANPAEEMDIRFLHFMQPDVVDRDCEFASPEALAKFVTRHDLKGTNDMLRLRVAKLLPLAGLAMPAVQSAEEAPYA